jgi:hypothetical protein
MSHWLDPETDAENIAWSNSVWQAMKHHTRCGEYVNQMGTETNEGMERIRKAYGGNYDRLVSLKRKYDANNMFCHNQNINPF